MSTGDRFAWCAHCGGYFPAGQAHTCLGRSNYTYLPEPGPRPDGAYVVPLLTEDRVRQIVREELERARTAGVDSVDGSRKP